MQYFLYLLTIFFLYFNYKIIISDLKYKKIPNKYLGYLLLLIPFYYIYVFFSFPDINYLTFILQIFVTFFISFILYFFGIWAAGDAKYLLVLALFIPYIGIVPFIGNIAIITIIYLLGYFIYFYLIKITSKKNYRKSLINDIKQDLIEKWKNYKANKGGSNYKVIFKWIIIFLIIFISIRLSRIYIINNIIEQGQNSNIFLLKEIINKYSIYIIFLFIGIFVGILYFIKFLINKIKKILVIKLKINTNTIGNLLLFMLAIFLMGFIIFEYNKNPYEIKKYLFRILTIYLIIYFIFKILQYSYKITFQIAETNFIDINNLKAGDIVDKPYLIKMFGRQHVLGYCEKGIDNCKEDGVLYPSPSKYFQNLENPIDKKDCEKLKKIYKIVGEYHKKNTKNFSENKQIKVLNTFAFGPYLFFGFLITFFLQDKIFKYIISKGIEIFKNIINN